MLTDMERAAIRTNIQKGIALLDIHHPGWTTQIDLPKLKIDSCSRCILGQLFKDYSLGLSVLSYETGECVLGPELGFSLSEDQRQHPDLTDWDELNEMWMDELRTRNEQ